jgi:hypothetical protein
VVKSKLLTRIAVTILDMRDLYTEATGKEEGEAHHGLLDASLAVWREADEAAKEEKDAALRSKD